jgi:hypothetical protein
LTGIRAATQREIDAATVLLARASGLRTKEVATELKISVTKAHRLLEMSRKQGMAFAVADDAKEHGTGVRWFLAGNVPSKYREWYPFPDRAWAA